MRHSSISPLSKVVARVRGPTATHPALSHDVDAVHRRSCSSRGTTPLVTLCPLMRAYPIPGSQRQEDGGFGTGTGRTSESFDGEVHR